MWKWFWKRSAGVRQGVFLPSFVESGSRGLPAQVAPLVYREREGWASARWGVDRYDALVTASRAGLRVAGTIALALAVAVGLGVFAAFVVESHESAFWLILATPTVAALAGVAVLARARFVLLNGLLGAVVACLAGLAPAERANESVYEPLLTDSALAVSWAFLGLVPVPLMAVVVWAARAVSRPEFEA